MNDEILSIGAIKKCMDDLDLHPSKQLTYEVDATIYNHNNHTSGSITVTFNSNWYSGDGPFIEVDDVIKSYGIHYTSFKPRWQEFEYDEKEKELLITGDGYKFCLSFK